MKAHLLPLLLGSILSAPAAEFVVTSLNNGVSTNYPLQPPAGAFVEVVQVGATTVVWPLKVTFADGRTGDFEAVNRSAGLKLADVASVEPITTSDHSILWKITPAAEFAKNGASYRTLIPHQGGGTPADVFAVPPDSLVKVIASSIPGSDDLPKVTFTSSVSGLSASNTSIPVPSPAYPFLTALNSEGSYLLIEVTPTSAPANSTVAIQQSDDLQQWETLHSFEVAPNRGKQFFRASITPPAP